MEKSSIKISKMIQKDC